MLKVGVAGLRRGWGLLQTFQDHRDAQVVALCDPSDELRQQAADTFGVEAVFADYVDMLMADLDVVVVATPAPLHAAQSIAAMEEGAHVLSEVPAVWTLEEAAALAAAVRRTGRVYMMAENMNFFHYIRDWKQRIQTGQIGDVFYAEAEYIHDCRSLMRDATGALTWRASMPPIQYCTHSLGPVLDMLDDRCVSVVGMATGSHTEPALGSTDMEVGLFQTAGGRVIKVLCGFALTREPAMHWQVFYGTQGSLENARVPWEEAKIFRAGDEKPTAISAEVSDPQAPPEALAGGHGTSEYYMVDGFIQAVIDGQQPPIDIYRSLDFSVPGLCAHLSAQQGGTPVQIQDYRDF
ncbi:MAG: Gfo/Idh/MocA family protein [Candidatus Latescibacterota bacterium]